MINELNPITREEMFLAAAAGQDVTVPEPITRKEMFLAKLVNKDAAVPAAITRDEYFIEAAAEARNASVIVPLDITENGTYTAPAGVDGYNPVTVNVEPVLQDKTVTENGEYTADAGFDGLGKVTVEVAGAGGIEPGIYFMPYEIPNCSGNDQVFFKLNGVMYAISNSQQYQSTASYDVYKYEGGAWKKIHSSYSINFGKKASKNCKVLMLNGKIHIFSTYSSTFVHYIFDEENGIVQHKTVTPATYYYPFIEDGKIKVSSNSSSYSGQVWDEETDTWSADANIPITKQVTTYGGEFYYILSDTVYHRKNGITTEICKLTGTIISSGHTDNMFIKEGYLYCTGTSGSMERLHETNLTTGETRRVANLQPSNATCFYTPGENDPILYGNGTTDTGRMYKNLFSVKIVR